MRSSADPLKIASGEEAEDDGATSESLDATVLESGECRHHPKRCCVRRCAERESKDLHYDRDQQEQPDPGSAGGH